MSRKTFVGFGFGPIQSALFLYEAWRSGNFSRFVVAEVDGNLVRAIRDSGGRYAINIALADRIETEEITGIELYDPQVPEDRKKLCAAIAESDEMATCLPSVAFFDRGSASVAQLLAAGLSQRKTQTPKIVYAAENHNHAAELLQEAVARHAPPAALNSVQFLNTVIGKMSGVITDGPTIERLRLATLTPGSPKAVLVEQFNRILISQITLAGATRGIDVFVEKPDLLPVEEAKLYGHNAIHALIGYLAARRRLATMADASGHADLMTIARNAFIGECGRALIDKHAALNDPLFTPEGFEAYADDLLDRMMRPTLNDLVSRVTRDPVRKLGADDRLFGTMRLALAHGIEPLNLARGAAAAVLSLIEGSRDPVPANLPQVSLPLTRAALAELLRAIWAGRSVPEADRLIDLTHAALARV